MPRQIEDIGEINFPDYPEEDVYEQEPLNLEIPTNSEVIEFTIQGTPISGSQLKFNRKTGNAYRPTEHKQRVFEVFEYACNTIPEDQRPYFRKGTPVVLGVKMYFPYRNTDYGTGRNEGILKPNAPIYYIGNKDLDNLLKPLKDGLKGVVINDDKQIVGYSEHWKLYSEHPRTIVQIKEVN